MDRALEFRDESPATLAARVASLAKSPFVRRSVGVMAIGLVNLLMLAALGTVLFVFVQKRTGMDLWHPDFFVPGTIATLIAFGATNAMLMALSILFAAFLMLVKQRLLHRAVVGSVALCFLVIALSSPGVGHAVGLEHVVAFWFCVLVLIPLRALGNWSIHWKDQMPGTAGTGQFSLADLLTWTTAIAATIGFLRVFFGVAVHAVPFSAVPVQYVSAVTAASSAAVLAAFVVAGPCMWLAASRRSRLRGSLRIALWSLAASLLWGAAASVGAIWFASYSNRLSPWGFWGTWNGLWGTWMPWWQMVVYACESLLYLLALQAALLANLFALEWLGLRWTKPV